jgi:hypothetical protein
MLSPSELFNPILCRTVVVGVGGVRGGKLQSSDVQAKLLMKLKFTLEQVTKDQSGSRDIALLFL